MGWSCQGVIPSSLQQPKRGRRESERVPVCTPIVMFLHKRYKIDRGTHSKTQEPFLSLDGEWRIMENFQLVGRISGERSEAPRIMIAVRMPLHWYYYQLSFKHGIDIDHDIPVGISPIDIHAQRWYSPYTMRYVVTRVSDNPPAETDEEAEILQAAFDEPLASTSTGRGPIPRDSQGFDDDQDFTVVPSKRSREKASQSHADSSEESEKPSRKARKPKRLTNRPTTSSTKRDKPPVGCPPGSLGTRNQTVQANLESTLATLMEQVRGGRVNPKTVEEANTALANIAKGQLHPAVIDDQDEADDFANDDFVMEGL